MIVRELLRETDFSGRYGGEEFCVALPNTPLEGGLALAERVRKCLEEANFKAEKGSHFQVTCSIGIAAFDGKEFDGNTDDHESYFNLVDTAL